MLSRVSVKVPLLPPAPLLLLDIAELLLNAEDELGATELLLDVVPDDGGIAELLLCVVLDDDGVIELLLGLFSSSLLPDEQDIVIAMASEMPAAKRKRFVLVLFVIQVNIKSFLEKWRFWRDFFLFCHFYVIFAVFFCVFLFPCYSRLFVFQQV